MKRIVFSMVAAGAAVAWAVGPVVPDESVTMKQDAATHRVTINYTLENEPAIVTVDVRTNGVSIGGANQWYFSGDVNRVVEPGTRSMTWRADKAWPDNVVTASVTAVVTAWATNAPPNYMVVSLVTARDVTYYTDADFIPGGVTNNFYKAESMVFRQIHAANVTWRMGSPDRELGRATDGSETAHNVTLSKDYFMAIYPCTQRQFECITGSRPSRFSLESDYRWRPVEQVLRQAIRGDQDWHSQGHAVDELSFFGRLRTLTGMTGFDLPTDAQWEFACRAGCGSALHNGHELENVNASVYLDEIAVYNRRYPSHAPTDGVTWPAEGDGGSPFVGTRRPNAWGLYDMGGAIWEICLDWYQVNIVDCDPERGPESGVDNQHVIRAGGFANNASLQRSAVRLGHPDLITPQFGVGFRAAYHP